MYFRPPRTHAKHTLTPGRRGCIVCRSRRVHENHPPAQPNPLPPKLHRFLSSLQPPPPHRLPLRTRRRGIRQRIRSVASSRCVTRYRLNAQMSACIQGTTPKNPGGSTRFVRGTKSEVGSAKFRSGSLNLLKLQRVELRFANLTR